MTFLWLVICIAAAGAELATMAMVSIWFAAGALAAMVCAFFGMSEPAQIIVFAIVSLIALAVFKVRGQKATMKLGTPTNADRVLGREGMVLKRIDNIRDEGLISVDGMEWTARASEDGSVIEAGDKVIVERIDGVKLIVRPLSIKES